MRISKEDFCRLDSILGKIGFGSYYDLIECIKMAITDICPLFSQNKDFDKEKDLYNLIHILLRVTKKNKKEKRGCVKINCPNFVDCKMDVSQVGHT